MMTTKDIWELYNRDVYHFILSKVKDEQISNDLLQETFIKIHTKLYTLKDPSKSKSWVFTIANFTTLDYFRSNSNTKEYEENDILLDEEIETHDEKDCLRGILKTLPKKYRDPLFLSDIKGMKQSEVSEQLKLKISTTKSRIRRARKLIEQGYMECCDFKKNNKGFLVGEIKDKEDCKVCN